MSVIYTPTGRAREYSPKALNIFLGCSHGCKYCYAPHSIQKSRSVFEQIPDPRPNLCERLEKQLSKETVSEQTLLSFVGDAYCESSDNGAVTRRSLEILHKNRVPVAILTKGGTRCFSDIDLFKRFGKSIMIGATLTFADKSLSKEWEPGAALPSERLEMLEVLHNNGIKTFASFEPVIDPEQSLEIMKQSVDCVDLYKIGKLNGMAAIEKKIDWSDFLRRALDILRPLGKEIYVKDDLALAASDVELTPDERNADMHTVKWVEPRPMCCNLDDWSDYLGTCKS